MTLFVRIQFGVIVGDKVAPLAFENIVQEIPFLILETIIQFFKIILLNGEIKIAF